MSLHFSTHLWPSASFTHDFWFGLSFKQIFILSFKLMLGLFRAHVLYILIMYRPVHRFHDSLALIQPAAPTHEFKSNQLAFNSFRYFTVLLLALILFFIVHL